MATQVMRNDSCPCARDELQDLFSVPDTQTAINKVTKIRKYPLTPDLNHDGPIEFYISNATTDFIDLANMTLHVALKVTKNNGDDLDADSQVAPINNLFHSLFKDVKLRLGKDAETLVTTSLPTYPYRAYLENLLSFGKGAKNDHLSKQVLWEKDTAGQFNSTKSVATAADGGRQAPNNKGLEQRQKTIAASRTFELQSRLHLDMCLQDRYLLDGVDLRLKLEKQSPKFFLMYGEGNDAEDYKVEFTKAYLDIPFVTLAPSTYTRVAAQLQSSNAKYPLKRVVVRDMVIPDNRTSHVLDNLFVNESLPKRLIVGMVRNTAYDGRKNRNPFQFEHNQLENIKLTKNGEIVDEYDVDFPQRQAIAPYLDLMKRVAVLNTREDLDLPFNDYINGYTLYCFDLTNDHGADGNYFHPKAAGNLSLELKFGAAPTNHLSLVLFAEYDNVLEIDANRQVITDW
ncbi:hypothetical protein SNE40_005125 [Patella caerulea]|uniref:Major capsid protein n=1 Tax=Patella caerulea TaxID=87958 RepID=A0AAN8K4E2_PATCE